MKKTIALITMLILHAASVQAADNLQAANDTTSQLTTHNPQYSDAPSLLTNPQPSDAQFLLTNPQPSDAQSLLTNPQPSDAQCQPSEKFSARQLIIPGALIAIGAWGVDNGWFCGIKEDVKEKMADWRGDHYFHADNYLQYLPVACHIGLGLTGIKSQHGIAERSLTTATAFLISSALTHATKRTVRERRPDTGARTSFPSGHSATAFLGAELVREEYGWGYGAGAYAVATTIGVLRLYNERHWLNDVFAGAGIGILSARAAIWLLPWERKILGMNKATKRNSSGKLQQNDATATKKKVSNGTDLAILPLYYPDQKGFSLSLSATF